MPNLMRITFSVKKEKIKTEISKRRIEGYNNIQRRNMNPNGKIQNTPKCNEVLKTYGYKT